MDQSDTADESRIARKRAYDLGVLIGDNASKECQTALLSAVLNDHKMTDSDSTCLVSRQFELGLIEGVVDAYLKRRRCEIRNAGSGSEINNA